MIVSILAVVGGIVVGAAALYATVSALDRAFWFVGYCRYYLTAMTRARWRLSPREIYAVLRASLIESTRSYGMDMTASCTNKTTGETIEFHPPFAIRITKKNTSTTI